MLYPFLPMHSLKQRFVYQRFVYQGRECFQKNRNRLFYFRMHNHSSGFESNFGDKFSHILAARLAKQKPLISANSFEFGKILGIGSILHHVKPFDIIWGAGVNGKSLKQTAKALHSGDVSRTISIRALRGPLTDKFIRTHGRGIKHPPAQFGDPGFLIAEDSLFPEIMAAPVASDAIVIIPHYSDFMEITRQVKLMKILGAEIISPDMDPIKLALKIRGAERVISTGLHGLIFAHALKTPCIHLRVSENEPDFKFDDLYGGIGAIRPKASVNLRCALSRDGYSPSLPSFQGLLDASPFI